MVLVIYEFRQGHVFSSQSTFLWLKMYKILVAIWFPNWSLVANGNGKFGYILWAFGYSQGTKLKTALPWNQELLSSWWIMKRHSTIKASDQSMLDEFSGSWTHLSRILRYFFTIQNQDVILTSWITTYITVQTKYPSTLSLYGPISKHLFDQWTYITSSVCSTHDIALFPKYQSHPVTSTISRPVLTHPITKSAIAQLQFPTQIIIIAAPAHAPDPAPALQPFVPAPTQTLPAAPPVVGRNPGPQAGHHTATCWNSIMQSEWKMKLTQTSTCMLSFRKVALIPFCFNIYNWLYGMVEWIKVL